MHACKAQKGSPEPTSEGANSTIQGTKGLARSLRLSTASHRTPRRPGTRRQGCTWKSGPLAHSGSVYAVSSNTDLYKNRFVERLKPSESWHRDLKSVPNIGNVFSPFGGGCGNTFPSRKLCASSAFMEPWSQARLTGLIVAPRALDAI